MNVIVLKDATDEALAAACWYDEQELGVGADFLSEYQSLLQKKHRTKPRAISVRRNRRHSPRYS